MGSGGEIFVLDMGEPIKISYLAEQMIRLSGKVPDEDIDIVYTGLRPGEKLFEELFHEKEALQSTGHAKILLARHREFEWERLGGILDTMNAACLDYDETRLRHLLKELVPEWMGIDPATQPGTDTVPVQKPGDDVSSAERDSPTIH